MRRYPIGVELLENRTVHARIWAPNARRVEVVARQLDDGGNPIGAPSCELSAERDGYFVGEVPFLRAGSLYSLRLDREKPLYPDPASRYQPLGPHGPSEIIDPRAFRWSDQDFPGVSAKGNIIYELHVGTFSKEGTYAAAQRELGALRELGVTIIELMPLAEFAGEFGWGYDGVNLFAPTRLYGRPDELRAFVDEAHRLGLAVILDVVYNHFGPDGNYLPKFSSCYVSKRYENEWGEAINFDGELCSAVREFFRENAAYWLEEYHFDGLRLDATQSMHDGSARHILSEISERVRAAARGKASYLVAENEPQHARLVRAIERGGNGLSALWNDDFHHSALVAVTGNTEAYYMDYQGTAQELISTLRWGFLYQGQRYEWQNKRRGTPAFDLSANQFVIYLENHDQVANSARGERLHRLTSPGRLRALTALFLLAPQTPMLFQGQEFASSAPFLYFADHKPELMKLVREGRRDFLRQFPALARPETQAVLHEPGDRATFERCKLDFSEREKHAEIYSLHRDLLRLRREDPAFAVERSDALHGAVLGSESFVLRFMCAAGDRLLLVNFGRRHTLSPASEPLLAPPDNCAWQLLWSSEDPKYGGRGTPIAHPDEQWTIPPHAAILLAACDIDASRSEP